MQSIENEYLKIRVQDIGAELCSIVSKTSGKEFMWSGDSSVWGSFAPVLFPIIGSLKESEFLYNGQAYTVPKHGFIRNNKDLIFKQISNSEVEYSLKFDEVSLISYPFKFEFFVRYKLNGKSIIVEHEIINHDTKSEMYFSLGGHPAFKCPINENESYEDYFLEFEKIENVNTWDVLSNGLIDTTSRPLLDNSNIIPLKLDLFANDALIIKNHQSKKVTLKSNLSKEAVVVEYSDFPYLGIWAKPGGKFVCIEPWLGISDSCDTDQNFETKEGILTLEPNSTFKASYKITIED